MVRTRIWYLGATLTAAVVGGSATALAAGFELLEQSAVTQGNAYAGTGARADDPSTMYSNPAGITKLPGFQISVGASGVFPHGTLTSGTATTGYYLGGTTYSGVVGTNSGSTAAVPNFTATAQVADTLFLGLGLTSPFGLATKYPIDSVARYYALTTQLRTLNIAPTIAWQALPQLSLGAGIAIETAEGHFSNAVDFGAIGALHGLGPYGLLPGRADGSATISGNDTALGWNVGALYEPLPGTRIGLAYRSAVFHDLSGTVTYYNVPAPLAASFRNQAASAKIPEPGKASLSIAQDLGPWTVLASLTYTGWSIFHSLTAYSGGTIVSATPESFHDTVAVAVGADYRVNDKLTVRAGAMFDPTPIQGGLRNSRLADNDRYLLSIGATYHALPNLALTAAYSHIFANDAAVNQVDAGPGTQNYLRGNLMAMYSLSVDIVSVELSDRF